MRITASVLTASFLFVILGMSVSCRRTLTEEQKEEMKEARQDQEIVRMTDQEVVQEALNAGHLFKDALENGQPVDSLEQIYDARVRLFYDTASMNELETDLWAAYQYGWKNNDPVDENIQRDYPEYLYYTFPLIENDSLKGMASVRLTRKQVILHH